MEVTAVRQLPGWTHHAFPIDDASRIGQARRHAAALAAQLDWSDVDAGRLALVVTELGTNLHRHAAKGRLLIAARAAMDDVEVLAVDEGPGIPDLQRSLRDGYSTGGTPGTGLGAVRRLADEFDLHSSVPQGTVCVARVRARGTGAHGVDLRLEIGAVCLPAPGETVSGDAWSAAVDGSGARLMVADGLGHGPEAAKASAAATAAFAAQPFADLASGLRQAHLALQTTRGAAVLLAQIEHEPAAVSYVGAGNVVGRVVSGVFDKSLITQHGTAGLTIRAPETATMALPPHALVILHSDGLDTRWKPEVILPAMRGDPSLVAAILWRDHSRQRDDATVVVVRRRT